MNDEIRISDALNAINFYAQPYIKFIVHLKHASNWQNPRLSMQLLVIWNCICILSGTMLQIACGIGLYFVYFSQVEAPTMHFVHAIPPDIGLPVLLGAMWQNSKRINLVLQYTVVWTKWAKEFAESGAWIAVVFSVLFLQQFSVPVLSGRNVVWMLGNAALVHFKPNIPHTSAIAQVELEPEQHAAITFQNQRWWLFIGWTDKMLSEERASWSNEEGTVTLTKEYFEHLNLTWTDPEWLLEVPVTNGRHVTNEKETKKILIPESKVTASVGWQYALNGTSWRHFSPVQVFSSAIRRRKWIRHFVPK